MFTWSLGCAGGWDPLASVAMTSLACMFGEEPGPVCRSTGVPEGEIGDQVARDLRDLFFLGDEELAVLRELVAGAIEIYLSTVNNNLSTIMKRLTGVTVVIAGIGAVGGIFGMSEAASALAGNEGPGFYIVVAVTIVASIVGVLLLRRINWL